MTSPPRADSALSAVAIDDDGIVATASEELVLDLLVDLYVIDLVHRHRAWFLEHGRISSNQAKDVVRRRSDLCAELRPYASVLVEAFAIPPEWLANDLASPTPGPTDEPV